MVVATKHQTPTFPSDWDEPFDDGEAFHFDPMHNPFPVSPLTQSTHAPASRIGWAAAAREQKTPIRESEVRFRNHYEYGRIVLHQPATEEEARQMAETAEAHAKMEIGRLLERWHGEHLPRLTVLHDRLRSLDVAGASGEELASLLDEAQTIHEEEWTIHFRIALPMLLAMQLYDELYADLFAGTEADAHALLVGVASESVKAGFGLSDLAREARELGLAKLIRETPTDALLPALEQSADGRAFLARLRNYLADYGLRQDLFELATPTWQEDPAFALANIRNYLAAGRDARAEHAAMAQSAADALTDARTRLAMYPEAVRGQFEAMLQFARNAAFLQEEHNFYIDQQGIALLRLFYLRVGERLTRDGWLAAIEDIFMLDRGEVRDLVAAAPTDEAIQRVRALVQERRAELAIAQTLTPPPFIGPSPDGPPPTGNPLERAIIRFFGGPPQVSETPGQLKGTAGSKGIATGPARVARTLEEATAVLPGEVLVAVTTMPPWTPLFGIAAAIVTETGGPLSHCAIVAREYGIPAVVGVHGATKAIVSGQHVTVDGGRGIVMIEG
jgi:rifampicin phosphotransferase